MNALYKIQNEEDVIKTLKSVKMVVRGGCLQPDDILEKPEFSLEVNVDYFDTLKEFELQDLYNKTLNGCVPIITKSNASYRMVWAYGFEVKFGRLLLYTSSGAISKDSLEKMDIRVACNLKRLQEALQTKEEDIEVRKTSETEGKLKSTSLFS